MAVHRCRGAERRGRAACRKRKVSFRTKPRSEAMTVSNAIRFVTSSFACPSETRRTRGTKRGMPCSCVDTHSQRPRRSSSLQLKSASSPSLSRS
jgi:hypothetical protein